jgi:hypothetical protein
MRRFESGRCNLLMSARAELIKGIYRAAEQDQLLRNHAYIGTYKVAGIEVLPMTARHFAILLATRNPFVAGKRPPNNIDAICLLKTVQAKPFSLWDVDDVSLIDSVLDYIEETFMDAPGGGKRGSSKDEPVASTLAWIVRALSAEYGWTEEQILNTSLQSIYQQARLIALSRNPKIKFSSNRVRQAWDKFHKANASNPASN